MAKRALRNQQRVEEAVKRKSFYESVMENPSSTKFYQLIKRSRTKTESKAACIQVDGVSILILKSKGSALPSTSRTLRFQRTRTMTMYFSNSVTYAARKLKQSVVKNQKLKFASLKQRWALLLIN